MIGAVVCDALLRKLWRRRRRRRPWSGWWAPISFSEGNAIRRASGLWSESKYHRGKSRLLPSSSECESLGAESHYSFQSWILHLTPFLLYKIKQFVIRNLKFIEMDNRMRNWLATYQKEKVKIWKRIWRMNGLNGGFDHASKYIECFQW